MSDQDNVVPGWIEFQLGGSLAALELFADFMDEMGAGGAVFSEDPAGEEGSQMVTAFLSSAKAGPQTMNAVKDKADELGRRFPLGWRGLSVTRVEDRDWAEEWKKGLEPERLEPGLWVVPSHKDVPREAESEKVLRIDPGMAFGTGAHHTTRMCVELVARAAMEGATSMLDIGTGTGILAMTGILFGVKKASAVDIDPTALRTAKENALANGLSASIEFGSGISDANETVPGGPFDLVSANLFAEALAELMPFMARHLRPGGKLVLSGIINEREELVDRSLANSRLKVVKRLKEEGWTAILAER